MFFNQYPYINENDLNLDFLLRKMKELAAVVEQFINAETIKFADPIFWDISKQYAKGTIVLNDSGDAYLSKTAVPVGIELDDNRYWLEIFNFADYVRTANENLTLNIEQNTTRASRNYIVGDWVVWNGVLYRATTPIAFDELLLHPGNLEHFTVENFIKEFMQDATNLINQYKDEIDASEIEYKEEMQAEIDRILAGATVDSEVIDAREGAYGEVYTTLGLAIRTQFLIAYNYKRTNDFMCELGSINATGDLVPSTVAARTNYLKCYTPQTIAVDTPYRIDVLTYNPDGTFRAKHNSWETSIAISPNYIYRLIFKKADNTNFVLSDFPALITSDMSAFVYFVSNDYVKDYVDNNISDVNNRINTVRNNFNQAAGLEVEIGSITSGGINAIANNRVRSNYIKVPASITINANGTGARISIYEYDSDGNYIGYTANQTSVTMSDTNKLYRLVAYYSDGRLMNRSMFANIVTVDLSSCEFYTTNIEITTNYKPLRGLTFSVLGDSISAYDGYVPSGYRTFYPSGDVDNVNKMFWKLLSDEEGMNIDIINAFSGSTVGTKWQPDSAGPRIPFIDNERLTNLGTSPDVIIVYGGTNDVSGNPLGNDYVEDGNYTDLFEFKHSYAYMLNQLKQLYPTSKILCIAIADKNNPAYIVNGLYPPKQIAVTQPLATDTTPHFLYEFNDVIKELCNRYSCVYVDIRDCFNFYNLANECTDPTGQTHPNAFGHYKIKERIKEKLIECFAR